jgi:multidrug efflux pump subunit AcrA (membrane-fusion protein)
VVSVDNSELKLFPGMTANTRIIVDRVEDALRIPSAALRFRPPEELKVIGDVGGKGKGGKGGFNKGDFNKGDFNKGDDSKSTDSKATDSKQTSDNGKSKDEPTRLAENTGGGNRRNRGDNVDANNNGSGPASDNGGFRRRGGNAGDGSDNGGRGNFDASQFKGRDGKNFDPSQFQGRNGKGKGGNGGNGGGNNFARNNGGGNANGGGRGGNNQFTGLRGGAGATARPTFQTLYRLTGKENEIEALRVRTGITDGNWIQLLPGNNGTASLKEGDELVTAVEGLPASPTQNKGNNPFGGNNNNNFKNKGGFGF